MDAKEFGAKLKDIRKEKKLTLLDLKARTGYSDSYLSQIENGYKDLPKPPLLKKIAEGLDISYIYLMNLAGYSDSYVGEDDLFKEERLLSKRKKVNVKLPCTEELISPNGEQSIRELSDDELRRRLFDLSDLLNLKVDLYYKNAYLTDEKRRKVKLMLELILE
ncbi:helix-turn-helix domain-containing protein [Bacillus sp. SJS]|uniref:helix-turn-helix domain-containing protein n=1 Tax=Bacillus sp. SJS TaxID=1423321 RepID=UPI0004DD7FFE|nr:helix-turn-helix transcriptional regulator [Bacillus sp. SJS]KZZ85532.1 transcriptional regulator [Bacillus sp. SJS]